MKIRFRCFPELEAVLPKPQPAKRGLPAWLKTMPLTAWAADFEEEVKTVRSEEHTSELQSLMRISYAVFCLKKKNKVTNATQNTVAYQPRTIPYRDHYYRC